MHSAHFAVSLAGQHRFVLTACLSSHYVVQMNGIGLAPLLLPVFGKSLVYGTLKISNDSNCFVFQFTTMRLLYIRVMQIFLQGYREERTVN